MPSTSCTAALWFSAIYVRAGPLSSDMTAQCRSYLCGSSRAEDISSQKAANGFSIKHACNHHLAQNKNIAALAIEPETSHNNTGNETGLRDRLAGVTDRIESFASVQQDENTCRMLWTLNSNMHMGLSMAMIGI